MTSTPEPIDLVDIIHQIAEGRSAGVSPIPAVHRFQTSEAYITAQRLFSADMENAGYEITPVADAVLASTASPMFTTLKNALRRSFRYTEAPRAQPRGLFDETTPIIDLGERIADIDEDD